MDDCKCECHNNITMKEFNQAKERVDTEMKIQYPFWKLIFKGKEQVKRITDEINRQRILNEKGTRE
ncbi:hypothetical protein LCGC14_2788040 [marine sediment metagenome]|uniref:Uncharacterized protein n=1 Tax=marine sediment metagenome TaxID=412755 RepID=A0A0F8YRB8_9ZZZZ